MKSFDYERLRVLVRRMTRQTKLYVLLKEELGKLGYWRKRARGNPEKGFKNGLGKHLKIKR